jgi:hypothetical protein
MYFILSDGQQPREISTNLTDYRTVFFYLIIFFFFNVFSRFSADTVMRWYIKFDFRFWNRARRR